MQERPRPPSASPTERTPFDVVTLVASAGGLEALSRILRELPPDFPAAVIVAQHLGGQGSALASILRKRTPLPVRWAEEGAPIRPGEVIVCPGRHCLEVLPDRTCALTSLERGTHDRPLDCLLHSLAESLGQRAIGVVLTGMGSDGAAGALALREAGGTVIAQSEETAEHPSMPLAATQNGAAELVLPLHEIGRLIVDLAWGGALPRPTAEIEASEALFAGDGDVVRLLREIDWSQTSLGPVRDWPAPLRTALRVVLESPVPAIVLWGADYVQLYNDHYQALMGGKHPEGLGLPNRECWPEVWHLNEPVYARVMAGEPVAIREALYPITRRGAPEDAWFSLYFAPVRDDAGGVGGVLGTIIETTSEVLSRRRLNALHVLAREGGGGDGVRAAFQRAHTILAQHSEDVPFAIGYLVDGGSRATLVANAGVRADSPMVPQTIQLVGGHPAWPLGRVVEADAPLLLNDLGLRFRGITLSDGQSPSAALLVPLRSVADERPSGVLLIGINPRLPLDAAYRGFLELVGAQVEACVTEAQSRQQERERVEKLAELSRAKTEFFSNVSHEFRTPLTLMLAPLEELLHRRRELPRLMGDEIEVAARNARRLLHLVNTLLDFSQVEAGRTRAFRVPVDLSLLTADITALFSSAAQRAGLRLWVDCPPLEELVWVDPEMWERIVSNLLSNALKFTFEGEIAVEIRALAQHVELAVRDTGVGIPTEEIPHLFKRFHRVRGTRARTQEGSGIGLAMVGELVRLHLGRVRVQSQEGRGTTITVWIPRGTRTLDEVLRAQPVVYKPTKVAAPLAEEAALWDLGADPFAVPPPEVIEEVLGEPLSSRAFGARVLVVDDNADVRDYLRRLLSPHWTIEVAKDGAEALDRARLLKPELIITDVMMPNLDGFELLRQIRRDEELKSVPVVLLTARAGEEAAIEGLLAGADDYVVKPFSARELVARIGAQIELTRVRRRTQELNELLVRFSDAVRGLTDPRAVAQTACQLVAEKLNVERAYWAEVDWTAREYLIEGAFHVPGVPVIQGRFPIDAWEPFTSNHLAGRPVVVDDTQTAPHIPPEAREGYAQIGVGADLAVPVTSEGQLVCTLAVNQRLPRRWTPDEVALVQSVAGRCWAEVERARAEAAVRESEARQAYLLQISDALRPISDAVEIEGAVTRAAMEHFGADRCYYCTIEEDVATIQRDASRPGFPSVAAVYPMADMPIFQAMLHSDRPIVVFDSRDTEVMDENLRELCLQTSILSYINVPVVKEGRLVGAFCLTQATPRQWSPIEVALSIETAERTWAAVERARAERALRESEARFRALVSTSSEIVYRMSPDWQEVRHLLGNGFLAPVPAPNGRWLDEYVPPTDQPLVRERIRRAIETKSLFELEHRVFRADGTLRWILSRAVPIFDDQGRIVEWFGAASDVTERKRNEEAQRDRTGESPSERRSES